MKTLLLLIPLCCIVIALTGCPEAQQVMTPVIDTEPADTTPPTTLGDEKTPEETPATEEEPEQKPREEPEETPATEEEPEEAPTPPADTTPPTVVAVGWFSDPQLTQAITEDMHPGDTVYTKVIFSEPMLHVVADDIAARPGLSYVIDGVATWYRIKAHAASGDAFQSGDAKPVGDGTETFICKLTLPAETVGTLAVAVTPETADTAGNPVAEETLHPAPFAIVAVPVVVVPPPTDDPSPPSEPSEPPGSGAPSVPLIDGDGDGIPDAVDPDPFDPCYPNPDC